MICSVIRWYPVRDLSYASAILYSRFRWIVKASGNGSLFKGIESILFYCLYEMSMNSICSLIFMPLLWKKKSICGGFHVSWCVAMAEIAFTHILHSETWMAEGRLVMVSVFFPFHNSYFSSYEPNGFWKIFFFRHSILNARYCFDDEVNAGELVLFRIIVNATSVDDA